MTPSLHGETRREDHIVRCPRKDRLAFLSGRVRLCSGRSLTAVVVLMLTIGIACSLRKPTEPEYSPVLGQPSSTPLEILTLAGLNPHEDFLEGISLDAFFHNYFSVFRHHGELLTSSRWAWQAFNTGDTLGENLQPVQPSWFARMDEEAAWENRGAIGKPGVSLVTTSLRAMPTDRPLITDPAQPGQGFPFDHLQNSLVNANEPLWLSHDSSSGQWTYVFTSYASGWIHNRDVAAIPSEHALSWPLLPAIAFTEDGYPVRGGRGNFLFASRVGMVMPLVEADSDSDRFEVLIATKKDSEGNAVFEVISIPARCASTIPTTAIAENLAAVASGLLGRSYGWGGLNGNRDCSSMIRDLFMPFGLWLPRNSKDQARVGRYISLVNLNENQKAELIIREGVPFATLLYKTGHILLYLGHHDREPVVLHSVWDLTVQTKEGRTRKHIGQVVLSVLRPLAPESESDQASTMLADLESMNLLVARTASPTAP